MTKALESIVFSLFDVFYIPCYFFYKLNLYFCKQVNFIQ